MLSCPLSGTAYALPDTSERVIATFATYYGASSEARKFNVELAARKIDGIRLYPEEEFSFNDTVGRRTKANGFRSAMVIEQGEFVEGIGGGVCQVSTTLYNCALLADLFITCVRPHSLAVSYVTPSFDAMVSSASDLRFVNSLPSPITVRINCDGEYITAKIIGKHHADIRRRSQTVETLPFETQYRHDPTLAQGEEVVKSYGRCGIRSQGFLEYFENGKLIKSVLIRKDVYAAQKHIVLVGTPPLSNEDNVG